MSEDTFITPYAAAKHVSNKLGINMRPQMMYNYARAHLLVSKQNEEGKYRISLNSLEQWLVKYAAKKQLVIK